MESVAEDSGARNIDSMLDEQILRCNSRKLFMRVAQAQTLLAHAVSISEEVTP